MSTKMTLNTEQVLAIAAQIDADNQELKRLLTESKSTIDGLQSSWTGTAADKTRSAYDTFSGKFFQTYYDMLEQYVKFLRSNVAEQYTETENTNTKLADQFL